MVSGYPDAKYKSFPSLKLAEEAFWTWWEPYYEVKSRKNLWKESDLPFERNSIAVDAACSWNPGEMEYRWVDLQTWEEIFHQRFDLWTNNVGEFLAIVHGMAWLEDCRRLKEITEDSKKGISEDSKKLQKIEYDDFPKAIYSDSKIAMNWVREKKCKSLLRNKEPNLEVWKAVDRAESWLKKNGVSYKILKWKTEDWGEIPADFGRK